jgi:orotidine-5'-phosphate decarboxylase
MREAAKHGIDGVIASAADNPDELRRIAADARLLVTTPGIRLATDPSDDHQRLSTPGNAIANGADYLVVGRPIIQHVDPAARAKRIIAEMHDGTALLPSSR